MWDETGDADGSRGGDAARADAEAKPSRPSRAASVGHAIVICCTEWKMIHESLFFPSRAVVRVHHGMCCIQGLTELTFRFGEQHGVLHSDVSSETDACK